MNAAKVVLDLGHSLLKGRTAKGEEITVPHALVQLSESQYLDILKSYGRDKVPADFIQVNGIAYAVGESAERYGAVTRYTGAERYRKEYIGVMAMSLITRLYKAATLETQIFASHPPRHIQYADELIEAIAGRWHVNAGGREYEIRVGYVNTFDEPTGGLMNVLLTTDGTAYQRGDLKEAKTLVIDIGGGTTDFIEVNNGEISYATVTTEPMGISQVLDRFEAAFRARYKDDTRGAMRLDPARIRQAVVSGIYQGGGRDWLCEEEATQSRNVLLNEVLRVMQSRYGGGFNYDAVLLTGGGCGLLYKSLTENIDNQNIITADDVADLHLANVRGGLKLWRLYEHFEMA